MYRHILLYLFLYVVWVNCEFNPYVNNHGTMVAIAGPDFCLLAADTRLASDLSVPSRNIERIFRVSRLGMLGFAGCHSDGHELHQLARLRSKDYSRMHRRALSPRGLAYLISNSLYRRRSFPFYSFCVVGGIDREGCGQLYKFDALGSMEQVGYACAGAGEKILQSLLDCTMSESQHQLQYISNATVDKQSSVSVTGTSSTLWKYDAQSNSFLDPKESERRCYVNMTADEACQLVKDAFAAAAERDITIGDSVNIHLLHRPAERAANVMRLFRIPLTPSGSRSSLRARTSS